MIASLFGTVLVRDDPISIIEVQGVGYRIYVAPSAFSSITVGKQVKLFIYTHVREDILDLYGFSTYEDLQIFELLLSVSGIGPKTAIGIFAFGGQKEIYKAIAESNLEFFTAVPRLGRKNAQKIIIELASKIGSKSELDLSQKDLHDNEQVIAALKSFGYTSKEAVQAIKDIQTDGLSTQEKVKRALQLLGK